MSWNSDVSLRFRLISRLEKQHKNVQKYLANKIIVTHSLDSTHSGLFCRQARRPIRRVVDVLGYSQCVVHDVWVDLNKKWHAYETTNPTACWCPTVKAKIRFLWKIIFSETDRRRKSKTNYSTVRFLKFKITDSSSGYLFAFARCQQRLHLYHSLIIAAYVTSVEVAQLMESKTGDREVPSSNPNYDKFLKNINPPLKIGGGEEPHRHPINNNNNNNKNNTMSENGHMST